MQLWPAIDLRGGRCVRLEQGDYDRETVFGDDPVAMARQWIDQGAEYLHLVDLDAARDGNAVNRQVAAQIAASIQVPVQLGGGVRSEQDIRQLVDLGIARLVVGTQALKDPEWFVAMCRQYPGRLVLGLDARDGNVATNGWLETSSIKAVDLAQQYTHEPLVAIVYTDIARDGMLSGPNVEATAQLQRAVSVPVIASGGVSSLDDLRRLAAAGVAGSIMGRALYERRFRVDEALAAVREVAAAPDQYSSTSGNCATGGVSSTGGGSSSH